MRILDKYRVLKRALRIIKTTNINRVNTRTPCDEAGKSHKGSLMDTAEKRGPRLLSWDTPENK